MNLNQNAPKTTEPTPEQKQSRIARGGETEFAAIVRNRSGQDAGEIDYGLKHGPVLDTLCDRDKQSLVDMAYALAEACERATGKKRRAEPDEQIGQAIIDAIASGGLMRAECVDQPDAPIVVVWKPNAAEQIGAMSLASKRN